MHGLKTTLLPQSSPRKGVAPFTIDLLRGRQFLFVRFQGLLIKQCYEFSDCQYESNDYACQQHVFEMSDQDACVSAFANLYPATIFEVVEGDASSHGTFVGKSIPSRVDADQVTFPAD